MIFNRRADVHRFSLAPTLMALALVAACGRQPRGASRNSSPKVVGYRSGGER